MCYQQKGIMLKAAHLIQRVWWLWLAVLVAGMPFSPNPARAEQRELYLFCGAGLRQPVDALLADFQNSLFALLMTPWIVVF